MSTYSTLDSHSRNCSSCIRQRELESGAGRAEKKASLTCERRKFSDTKTSLLRRSNSSLSHSDVGGSGRREETSEQSAYITPTQRKNLELKKIRLELLQTNQTLQAKEREIIMLKKEVAALKESKFSKLGDSWAGEAESWTDSGNCEELCTAWEEEDTPEAAGPEQEPGNKLENIDFELMETALKEEEETRHKLQENNEALKEELESRKQEYQDKLEELKKRYESKTSELVKELSESSLRCSRQQELIEQNQNKIESFSKTADELYDSKKDLARSATQESDSSPYLIDRKPKVELGDFCCQTDENIVVEVSCQTDELPDPNISLRGISHVETIHQSNTKSDETICDNKIHYTFQFLRRSIFYFITDKENSAYHLRSIQRLLEFSDVELSTINNTRPVAVRRY